jgi:Protein of unknown function (DUF669)
MNIDNLLEGEDLNALPEENFEEVPPGVYTVVIQPGISSSVSSKGNTQVTLAFKVEADQPSAGRLLWHRLTWVSVQPEPKKREIETRARQDLKKIAAACGVAVTKTFAVLEGCRLQVKVTHSPADGGGVFVNLRNFAAAPSKLAAQAPVARAPRASRAAPAAAEQAPAAEAPAPRGLSRVAPTFFEEVPSDD